MRRYVFFFIFAATFFSGANSLALAETVLRTGSDISVASDQVIEGNYYVSAYFGQTNMSGQVGGDMIAAGGMININGEVKQDLHILGGTVHVHGVVGEDLRIIGGEVTIGDVVTGDLFVIANSLLVLPSAEIGGDVFFFGSTAEIQGAIEGSLYGSADKMHVNAAVARDVDVRSFSRLSLGERASIGGSLRYTSMAGVERDSNARIEGEVVQNKVPAPTQRELLRVVLIPFLIILFSTLSLYLIFKRESEKLIVHITHSIPVSGFVGLGVLVLGPIIAGLLIATVLGSLIGVLLFFLVILLLIASVAFAPIFAGSLLARLVVKQPAVSLLWILAGSITMYTMLLVPVVGIIIYIALVLLTLGGLVIALYKSIS